MGNLIGTYFAEGDKEEKQLKKFNFKNEIKLQYDDELGKFLSSKTLSDLDLTSLCRPPKNAPKNNNNITIQVDAEMDAKECFNLLVQHHIHSCPVYDPKSKEYIGLIDWQDFTSYLVQFYDAVLQNKEVDSLELKAKHVCNYSGINLFRPIYTTDSLIDVLKAFRAQSGVHRCPVFDSRDTRSIISVCSQSAIVKWLTENIDSLGTLPSIKISSIIDKETDTTTGSQKLDYVLTVNKHPKMINVLRLMVDTGINGVAVVKLDYKGNHKGEGRLIGNVSVSDLKYLVGENIGKLEQSVGEFLKFVKQQKQKEGESVSLITCSSTSTFGDVLHKFVETGVHRIYVVDGEMHVKAVVTLTDVIEAVLLLGSKD